MRFGDAWVILSAKVGFITPDALIPGPYHVTFTRPASGPITDSQLTRQVREQGLGEFSRVIVLGGKDYRGRIEHAFSASRIRLFFPFAGMQLGESLGSAKKAIARGNPLPD